MPTITDENDIKRLVKQTIAPADLASAVEAGDRKIVALTNRDIDEWNPTDNAYGQLQQVGATYGAWTVLMGWNKEMYLDKAKEMWKAYIFEIEQFKSMRLPDNLSDPNFDIAESVYTHYKLNADYVPFMSSY
jgi:hypothetical protein